MGQHYGGGGAGKIRVAVIGNSNSVMQDSFARSLAAHRDIEVVNRSIGSSPNVVLLDFLALEDDFRYDFIIVETCVVDAIQSNGLYSRSRALETLELFISCILSKSDAQIVVLIVPTQFALAHPDSHWQETLYTAVAERYHLPVLNGYALLRSLLGQTHVRSLGDYWMRAVAQADAFGLSHAVVPALAWRQTRDRHAPASALACLAFADAAHFSPVMHKLVARLLTHFLTSMIIAPRKKRSAQAMPFENVVLAAMGRSDKHIVRTSSLMTRTLNVVEPGDILSFDCPADYMAYGMLVNQSQTTSIVRIKSALGDTTFDMQFSRQPFDWVGAVVAILDPVGGGKIEVTISENTGCNERIHRLHSTQPSDRPARAEIGELLLVRRDWRNIVPISPRSSAALVSLESTPWAEGLISEACMNADLVLKGIEAGGSVIDSACQQVIDGILGKSDESLSSADQARLLLTMGRRNQLLSLLADYATRDEEGDTLSKIYTAMRADDGHPGMNPDPRRSSYNQRQVLATLMDDADSLIRGNRTQEAQEKWAVARTMHDAPIDAWTRAGDLLSRAGDDERAISLFQEACERFPTRSAPHAGLARIMEHRKAWDMAEHHWRAFIRIDGDLWWGRTALAANLNAQSRFEEAYAVLVDAAATFPREPQIFVDIARLHQTRGRCDEAVDAWNTVIRLFPDRWVGYRGKIAALAQSGRSQQADELFSKSVLKFRHDADALHDAARAAERKQAWLEAEDLWRAFLEIEQRPSWAYRALAVSLRKQAKYTEALKVLRGAMQQFPDDRDVLFEAATCSELADDLDGAMQLWGAFATRFPRSPESFVARAGILRRIGKFANADDLVQSAVRLFPDEPSLLEAYGLNALDSNDWTEAYKRFVAGQNRFPAYGPFHGHLNALRQKKTEDGRPVISPEDQPGLDQSSKERAILMDFESLGGGGHGCEFGLFQRHFGAEPLGLLRWADVYQDQLCPALETELAGIGEPEFTNIFVPSSADEYWTTDKRYHMAMRTFVKVADVAQSRMAQQVARRMSFLRRKLIDDLRTGSKLFVYKNMKRNLTPTELKRLHAACRRYGNNTLFYIQYEDADHPNGTVKVHRDGLMVGYIDHFSHTPDTDTFIDHATDALLALCRTAHRIWREQQGQTQVATAA